MKSLLSFTILFVLFLSCSQLIIGKTNYSIATSDDLNLVEPKNNSNMKLGAFSISLNVKDLKTSKAFYENLGFEVLGGDIQKNYLIMKNENALIGLFQGMFAGNILTFNPGWDESGKEIEAYDDVRAIQKQLKEKGVTLDSEVDESTSGPGNFILKDPDGNMIYIDQHL